MHQKATFAAGCFWGVEAAFKSLEGVIQVTSGYSGGTDTNPTYEKICTGKTGHAECVEVIFEDEEISYQDLLNAFFQIHDPTTKDRQGVDIGTQYRSAIFYHDENQHQSALSMIQDLDAQKCFSSPIVTELNRANIFYAAEDYHQDYFAKHPERAMCHVMPKIK